MDRGHGGRRIGLMRSGLLEQIRVGAGVGEREDEFAYMPRPLLAGPAVVVGLVPAAVGQAASAAAATRVCQILGFLIDKSSDS